MTARGGAHEGKSKVKWKWDKTEEKRKEKFRTQEQAPWPKGMSDASHATCRAACLLHKQARGHSIDFYCFYINTFKLKLNAVSQFRHHNIVLCNI